MEDMYSSEFLLTHKIQRQTFQDEEEAKAFKKHLKEDGYKVKSKKMGLKIIVEGIKELTVKEAMQNQELELNDRE
jgi:TPP-dependent indolepyruvate ferredoxin oxidoreductase alpha subunit